MFFSILGIEEGKKRERRGKDFFFSKKERKKLTRENQIKNTFESKRDRMKL